MPSEKKKYGEGGWAAKQSHPTAILIKKYKKLIVGKLKDDDGPAAGDGAQRLPVAQSLVQWPVLAGTDEGCPARRMARFRLYKSNYRNDIL